jgi:hypothetical protein
MISWPLRAEQLALQGVEGGQLIDVRTGDKGFFAGTGEDQDANVFVGHDYIQMPATSSSSNWPLRALSALGRLKVMVAIPSVPFQK